MFIRVVSPPNHSAVSLRSLLGSSDLLPAWLSLLPSAVLEVSDKALKVSAPTWKTVPSAVAAGTSVSTR